MRVFIEKQKFTQWWLYLILILILIHGIYNLVASRFLYGIIETGIAVLMLILFVLFRLETKIDHIGIQASFQPFSCFKRSYRWKEIEKCYVRKYSALSEYGGWGIRGFGKADAYNVKGNMGIQIITIHNEKFLIGTNKAVDVKRILERYHN